ncbi:MAG: hypothetical protein AAF235_10430, partial [Planctomycetota bacterium]
RGQIELLAPTDPQRQAMGMTFQQKLQQLQQTGLTAQEQFAVFVANQAADAYERVRETAEAMGRERGYGLLIASRDDAKIADRPNLPTVMQEILSRPVLISSDANDITEAVREALDLPEVDESTLNEIADPMGGAATPGG